MYVIMKLRNSLLVSLRVNFINSETYQLFSCCCLCWRHLISLRCVSGHVTCLHSEERGMFLFKPSDFYGTKCVLRLACRVRDEDLKTTKWERQLGVGSLNWGATRLLYACLTPLGGPAPGSNGPGTYREFLQGMPEALRRRLICRAVIDFVRRAMKVPAEVPLLVLLLVDDGEAARDTFPDCGPEQVSYFDAPSHIFA